MREEDLIRVFVDRQRRSPAQKNAPFTSDAEIVDLDGALLALTVDEFSPEDGLDARDPGLLGWNVTVATMSDLLAVGAEPRFLLDSLVVEPGMDREWVSLFSGGVREALDAYDASLLGGDVGTDSTWRFSGFALGTFPDGRPPMMRPVSAESGIVFATGSFGDGNLAVVTGHQPRFECRRKEAEAFATGRASAIDTSDGLGRALEIMSDLSPGLRVEIDLAAVNLAPGVRAAANGLLVPPAAFLLGSAGEYELLAFLRGGSGSVPAATTDGERFQAGRRGRSRALQRGFGQFPGGPGISVPTETTKQIGTFMVSREPGLFYRLPSGELVSHERLPDPRETPDLGAYRERIGELAKRLSSTGGDG